MGALASMRSRPFSDAFVHVYQHVSLEAFQLLSPIVFLIPSGKIKVGTPDWSESMGREERFLLQNNIR